MADINPFDIVDIRVMGTLFEQEVITSFPYVCITGSSSTGGTIAACSQLAGDWKAGTVSPFLGFLDCCPPDYEAVQVQAQVVYPTRYRYGYNNVGLPGTNAAGATQSTNQAAFIERSAEKSGRKYVGGIHVPGVAAANMLGGMLTNAFIAKLQIVADRMTNLFTSTSIGAQFSPIILHRPNKKAIPPVTAYSYDISKFTYVQHTARVMRRRTIGVGK